MPAFASHIPVCSRAMICDQIPVILSAAKSSISPPALRSPRFSGQCLKSCCHTGTNLSTNSVIYGETMSRPFGLGNWERTAGKRSTLEARTFRTSRGQKQPAQIVSKQRRCRNSRCQLRGSPQLANRPTTILRVALTVATTVRYARMLTYCCRNGQAYG